MSPIINTFLEDQHFLEWKTAKLNMFKQHFINARF